MTAKSELTDFIDTLGERHKTVVPYGALGWDGGEPLHRLRGPPPLDRGGLFRRFGDREHILDALRNCLPAAGMLNDNTHIQFLRCRSAIT